MKQLLLGVLLHFTLITYAQLSPLTVEKIMRDPKWIGASPSNLQWTADGKHLLFNWNPEKATIDSLYYITPTATTPQKTTWEFRKAAITGNQIKYNAAHDQYVYAQDGDVYLLHIKTGLRRRVTQTAATEMYPQFAYYDQKIVYTREQNAWAWDIQTGTTTQLTNFQTITPPAASGAARNNQQEKWLQEEALENSIVLQRRQQKKDQADSAIKKFKKDRLLRTIPLEGKNLAMLNVSYNGQY
ncbi:MAG TPA: hypothetical protein VM187_07815, partial [Niastella sp.]|nr:hypothetical protein [Niastella sp.]